MTDDSSIYTVQPGDTLSVIAGKKGVPWKDIARANEIGDPRSLQVGQQLRIPKRAGKITTNTLDAEHNPLPNASYRIRSGDKLVSGKTSKSGQLEAFWPDFEGQTVEIFFQKLNGEWKKVYETVAEETNKLVTLVSPRLKISMQTQPHPQNGESRSKPPQPAPKAPPAGDQTDSSFAPGKGVKTTQTADAAGAAAVKVTSDDASLDEFLDKYTGDPITEKDFEDAAKEIGCKVNVIKAVHQTEVGGGSFTTVDGRTVPKILYERHYFYKLSGGKYWDTNPDLSWPTGYYRLKTKYIKKTMQLKGEDGQTRDVDVWVRYNAKKDKDHAKDAETAQELIDDGVLTKERDTYGSLSYRRLRKAFKLDASAALQACSWGAFQIMGSNYKTLGYATVQEMVKDMSRSERPHLKGFVNFVKADPALVKAAKNEDFAAFASRYNGPTYKENDYDTKMKNNFDAFEKADAAKKSQKDKVK
jgi:murein DD-endopeptidase MepM/ murein hydrolase activator NlpD